MIFIAFKIVEYASMAWGAYCVYTSIKSKL